MELTGMYAEAPRLLGAVNAMFKRVEYTIVVTTSANIPKSPPPRLTYMDAALKESSVRCYNRNS